MNSLGNNINFSFEYAVSIIIVLVVCYSILRLSPGLNIIIVLLAGLLAGYLSLFILNNVFPSLNKTFQNIQQYYTYQIMNNFNSMGYMHVWPPILAVLIIFIILLYNKNLG
jgi:hypothetical protein